MQTTFFIEIELWMKDLGVWYYENDVNKNVDKCYNSMES